MRRPGVALSLALRWTLAAAASLPLPAAQALGRGLGILFFVAAGRQRRRALRNLARCFPDLSPAQARRIARRVFSNIGMNQLEMLRWMGGRTAELEARIHVTGFEHARQALDIGRGVVVLTAHVGNWDLLALWAASRWPLTIISKEIKNSTVNAFWMEQRRRAGLRIVGARNSYRACLATLRRGEMLGFVLDQNMIRADGVFVDFFGRAACTTPGLAVLAAHAGAVVLPVFMLRRPDGGHEVRILPGLPAPLTRRPDDVLVATQGYTRLIEDVIREHREQWIWMHRRWRTQPRPAAGDPRAAALARVSPAS